MGLAEHDLVDLGLWTKLGPRKRVLQMKTTQKNMESMPQEVLHFQVLEDIPLLNQSVPPVSAVPLIEVVCEKSADIEREVCNIYIDLHALLVIFIECVCFFVFLSVDL